MVDLLRNKGYVLIDALIAVFISMVMVSITYASIQVRFKAEENLAVLREEMELELLNGYYGIEECELCLIEEEILP